MYKKYWMHATEQMLVISIPEERKKDSNRITALLVEAYTTWSNPEEDYDDEDIIEAIYDSRCDEFIMGEVHNALGYKLEYTLEEDKDEDEVYYILDVM